MGNRNHTDGGEKKKSQKALRSPGNREEKLNEEAEEEEIEVLMEEDEKDAKVWTFPGLSIKTGLE